MSSSNTSPAASDTIIINNQTLFSVSMANVSKLTPTNYLMWSLQVHDLLDGHALAGYLDGFTAIPSETITLNTQVSVNPAFTTWKRQDKLIYNALLGAISLNIQPIVSRATTSVEIWNTLAMTYAKSSRGHIK